jgi:hypothetical protein
MKIAAFVLIVTAALNVTTAFAYDAEGSGKVSNGNCTCKKIVTGSPKQANSRGRNWPRPLSLWAVASERFLDLRVRDRTDSQIWGIYRDDCYRPCGWSWNAHPINTTLTSEDMLPTR